MRLDGKIALITGGGNGIGRSAALRFAQEGARVIIADIDHGGLEAAHNAINQAGGSARTLRCDVGNESDIRAMFDSIAEMEGRLDVLYNNAGIAGAPSGITEQAEDNWQKVFRVNTEGAYHCCREAVPLMIAGGSIINQSSIAALVGGGPPGLAPS